MKKPEKNLRTLWLNAQNAHQQIFSIMAIIIVMLLLLLPRHLHSQVQINLQLPPPGSLDPEQLTELISFNNIGTVHLYVQMVATIEEEEKGLVFSGSSGIFDLPVGFSSPDYTVYEPVEVQYSDPDLEAYVIQTNSMPGGDYVVCITLIDAEMGDEVGYNCVHHSVFHPSAPMLVYPADGDVVLEPAPVFIWLPPTPMPPIQTFYFLRMVELLEGQLPYEALQSNPAWFEDSQAMTTTYPYPADAEPMETGKTYAWQVQALMADGFPVGENHGHSEIHTFQYSTSIMDDGMLTWKLPLEGKMPRPVQLIFEWFDPLFEDELPPYDYFYALELVPLMDDEPAEDEDMPAVPLLFPHINEPTFIYPAHLPLLTDVSYAATVYRIQQEGYFHDSFPVTVVIPDPDESIIVTDPFEPFSLTLAELLPPYAGITANSPRLHFSFTEATLEACCDTIAVMNKIWGDIGAIKKDICNDKKDLMDELLDALDDYMDKQWGTDALKGRLDAAAGFKDKLQAFKDHAMDGLQSEIDRLNDLRGDCNTTWEADFHRRYVANPSVGGSYEAKTRRYNLALRSIQRRFDRRLNNQISYLQRRKDEAESRYDDLMGRLEDYTTDTQDAHDQAQQAADDALDRVNDLFNRIKDNLCGIEGRWDDLFAFMRENFCCLTKCAEEQVPVPPEFAEMEDCLRDLFNRLLDWKGKIREAGNRDELAAQANNVFDADGAMEQLQALKDLAAELDAAVDDFNATSRHVKLVDRACHTLHMYASGGRSPGMVRAPSDNRGARYGAPMISKVFAYQATGHYAPSQRTRMEAARERRTFQRQHGRIVGEMNRQASRLGRDNTENGFARPEVIEAHGKGAAVPHHEHTAQTLDQMIDAMLDALRNCYDIAKHHRQRRRFNDIMTECVAFREALGELDEKYADHAEKTAEEEARLRDQLAEVERLIRQLRDRSSEAGASAEALKEMIEEIERRMNELSVESVHNDLSEEKRNMYRDLQQRLSELQRRLREAERNKAYADTRLEDLEQLRNEIREAIERFGEITPPTPISSTDEANEASGRVDDERREKETKSQQIRDLINSARRLAGEVDEAIGNAGMGASSGLSKGSGMLSDLADWLEYLRRRTDALREHERRRRQADCLRLLEEFRAMQDPDPGFFTRIWEFFWSAKEELDAIPEGVYHDLDQFREYLNKLEELKGRIETALTLLRGINTEDPIARARAFGQLLDIGEEIGGEVPGFGEMMMFYAKAYKDAIEAIGQIAEAIRRPAKEAIDSYTISCSLDAWQDSSLEQIMEAEWQRFRATSGEATLGALSHQQQGRMEAYFKNRAANRVMECCIQELMK